jgi:hypothetical protein
VDDPEPVLAGEVHDSLEEVAVHHPGRRVVREVEQESLGLGPREPHGLLETGEELAVALADHHGDRAEVAVGDHDRVGVNRVGGVGDEHRVPRLEEREHQVGQALLRADGRDRLGLGIELDPEAVAVPGGDRDAEPADAARCRVPVVARSLRSLDELVDDVAGRRSVGIAHAKINDVLAAGARLDLEIRDRSQHVGREPLDPVEIVHVTTPSRG